MHPTRFMRTSLPVAVLVVLIVLQVCLLSWLIVQRVSDGSPTAAKQAPRQTDQTTTPAQTDDLETPADETVPEASSEDTPESTAAMNQRLAANVQRKQGAYQVATHVAEYMANNYGHVPTAYTAGKFTSPYGNYDQPVTPGWYKDIMVTAELSALPSADTITVVTAATCNDTKTAPVAGNTRQYVVLYGVENAAGSFDVACVEG